MQVPFNEVDLNVHTSEPLNAGTPLELLSDHFITPSEYFFVRNHGNIPEIDSATYRLTITGAVKQALELSLSDLKNVFASAEVVATIQCAGNRREELRKVAEMPGELLWNADGISTAIWKGVPLKAILEKAGLDLDLTFGHVAFTGLDTVERHHQKFGFGGSIELPKALEADVLLAYEMNGQPLTAAHGFPLRLIVPGYIGARSIKWLANINVQTAPSSNYFQTHAYKLFPNDINATNVEWEKGQMLTEFRLNSAACQPEPGAAVVAASGKVLFKGYAIAPAGAKIERVELSSDGGRSWQTAQLRSESQKWTWVLWESELELPVGPAEIFVRAFDNQGRAQPETLAEVWNFKGYLNNAWQRFSLTVKHSS